MKKITIIMMGVLISIGLNAQLIGTSSFLENQNLPEDGDGTLGTSFSLTKCGLNYDYATTKITTRYPTPAGCNLPCTLNVPGVPQCAVIEKALLYYASSSNNLDTSISITNTNSQTFNTNAKLIGSASSKCWGEQATRNFRVDITPYISGPGDYIIESIGQGVWSTDGISILIIYSDPTQTYEGTMVIDDGCISAVTVQTNYTMTGLNVCDSSSTARAFMIVTDMQDNVSASHIATLNGDQQTFPNLFYNFNELNTTVSASQTTSDFSANDGTNGDCYDVMAVGLYYQTTNCNICIPPDTVLEVTTTGTDDFCGACTGTALTVVDTGGSPPYSYQWSNNTGNQTDSMATGLCAGTYYVTVSDGTGCYTKIDSVTLINGGGPTVSTAATSAGCEGECNADATATIGGGNGNIDFEWDLNTGNQTTQTATGLCSGTYYITVTDSAGCKTVDSIVVTAIPLPPAPTASGATFCPGQTVTGVGASGGSGDYNWYYDETTNNFINNGLTPDYGGITSTDTVWVTQTENGCEGPPTMVILTVLPGPVVDFTATPDNGEAPLEVDFTNNSICPNTCTYSWDFQTDGEIDSDEFEPSFTYETGGIYKVTLCIEDENGCTACDTTIVIVDQTSSLFVPNIFTPNKDGSNDLFNIQAENLTEFHCIIYNRWGRKLYEWTNHPADAWDGTVGGKPVVDGVYYYILTGTGVDEVYYKEQGYITLIR